MDIFLKIPPRTLLLALAAAAAAILGVALVAQYGFGLHPCELCMFQRYPYAAIIILGGLAVLVVKSPQILWTASLLCGFILLAETGIATYHAGVELGIFPGPTACSSTATQGETLEDMRRALMNAPLVPCDQPMVHVLGLSMAAWNAFTAAALTVFTFLSLYKRTS